jgi:poly-beta-1,6-N-acetyl-D-glucosamine N-deacetylase
MKRDFRNLSAWFVANLLILLGFVRQAVKRAMNGEFILSVYFHKPSKEEFESCINWLKKNKFHFLSTSDLDVIIQNGHPFPKGAVILTVDDGWQSNEANIVEVANKYGVPVTIFVSTAPVEEGTYWWSYVHNGLANDVKKHTSKKELKKIPNKERLIKVEELKKGVFLKRDAMTIEQVKYAANSKYISIGGHTHTHPILINCNDDEVYSELELSKQKLESWINKKVICFAYPNGDYSKREMQVLQELDYHFAFCSEPRYLTSDIVKDKYILPRFGFLEGASFAENICRITGVWKTFKRNFNL